MPAPASASGENLGKACNRIHRRSTLVSTSADIKMGGVDANQSVTTRGTGASTIGSFAIEWFVVKLKGKSISEGSSKKADHAAGRRHCA